jgi:hypothetical protein
MKKTLFILFVIGCIANSNAQVPSYVPTDGLVAYYPLNGNANDETGNGYNLVNNNVTFDNDRFENQLSSAYFSGNGSELFLENSINQLLTEDPNQTFSFWFKSVTPNNRYIFEYGSQSSHRYRFVTSPNNAIGIRGENEECTGAGTDNEAPELHSGWHHFVVSINSSNYTVYYDGEVLFSKAHSGFNCVDSNNKLNIGNDINGGEKEYTNMIMDDIGIWNRALTEQEVANLYTSNNTSSDTDFLTFSLDDEIEESNINLDEHTIDLKVYSNIDITSLIPSFTVSDGAIVKVDDELQERDVTSNDFTDSVIYRVISQDGTIEQNWTVSVKNNNKPVIVDDYFTITEDSDNEFIFNITENDIDSDGDMVTVVNNSLNLIEGYKGGYEINDDGNLIFTPNQNACGETVLEYKITDSYEESDVGLITINIEPIHDDAPVAIDDTYTVFKNSDVIEIDVLNNDFDPDNLCGEKVDSLTILYAVSSGPGEISVSENNLLLNYKPGNNFSGIEEITYIITDGDNDAVGKLIVTVNNELMELQEILNLTFTTGTGGTNGHDDFGQKSYDIFSDMLSSDMALSTSTYGWYRTSITEYQATQDYTFGNNRQVWSYYYRIITRCNFLIDKINTGNIDSSDQTESVLGQVKTLRAYAYFYLTQFFQNEYNGSEEILPILLHDGDYYQELRTADEIYNLVESDLQEAIALLDGFTRSSKTEINKSVAQGIYAYVLGARGTDYATAYSMAKAAIDGYALMNATEITGGFNNVATPGWMWGVDLNDEIGLGLISWWGQMDYYSYSYPAFGDAKSMDQTLFDAIPATDSRKEQFNNSPGEYEHLMPLFKFYDADKEIFGSSRIVKADYVYMRVAEMHLLAAEYAAYFGIEAQARNELKALVSNRVPDASYIDGLSGQALKDEIYLQTRIELWGEGKSYLAMKRNKATVTRGSNHLSFVGESIPYNDERMTFEIPQGFGYTPNDPKISLIGDDLYRIELGESFDDPGAYAVNSENIDISDNILITGNINNNIEGEYTLVYSVSDSLGRSAIPKFRKVIVERNTLGLVDSKKIEFSIFPNPSKGIINIKSEEELKSIEIYSILGEKVMFFEKKIQQLNIKNLSKGIYIMKLITNQGSAFKKFVKN